MADQTGGTAPHDRTDDTETHENASSSEGIEGTVDTATGSARLAALKSMKIGGRLNAGFAGVCVVMAALVLITVWQISSVSVITQRVVELRVPTSTASLGLVNNINSSLAALRGWMITGNPKFKDERAGIWANVDRISGDMDRLSATWTVPANVEKWTMFKETLAEFRIAQQKVEDIAKSADEQPATKILVNDAAPKASIMVNEITEIINAEATLPVSQARKELFAMMADVRGTTARGLANIRAFLLTGNDVFHKRFDTM